MTPTSSHRIFAASIYIALSAVSLGAIAQQGNDVSLSVDMPSGGCRLTVQPNGSASIYFGAMPRRVNAAPGTFSFEQLVASLRAKSYPQSARNATEHRVGSLSLPGNESLLFIDDYELVRSLLDLGWKARVIPTTPYEVENYAWVSSACALS
jgi:hypothetical protein